MSCDFIKINKINAVFFEAEFNYDKMYIDGKHLILKLNEVLVEVFNQMPEVEHTINI